MKKENNIENKSSINSNRRKLLSLAGAAGTAALLSPLLSKAAPSTIIEAGSNVDTASYIIFKDENTIYAKNGMTGKIDFQGSDASMVIQSAINTLTNGGKIFIKAGTYNISSSILISKDSIAIEGEGKSTILKLSNGATNVSLFNISRGSTRTLYIDIRNMLLDGNKANASGTAIEARNIWYSILENLWIQSFANNGIDIEDAVGGYKSQDNWINKIYVLSVNGYACYLKELYDTVISDCNFSSIKEALYLYHCYNIEFTNLHLSLRNFNIC